MKKRFTRILAALALLVGLTIPMGVWGQTTVTFTAGTDTGENSVTKDGVTVSMSTMSRTDNYRCYANSDMSVASTVGNITSVVVTCTANGTASYGPGNFSVSESNPGIYTYESNGHTGTWSGNAASMALHASAQVRMTQIVVTVGGSAPATFTVNLSQTTGGTISATPTSATAGTNITLTATPAEGYSFDSWSIEPSTVTITDNQFTMPASNVTVSASWTENGGGSTNIVTYDFTTVDNFLIEYPGSTHPSTGTTINSFYYTNGDHFAAAGNDNCKFNSGYFILGKTNATLTLPIFDFDVEKIEIIGRSGASGQVKQNIYVGDEAVSTETTGATGTNTYIIADGYQAAGNVYVLKVTSAANTQITGINIYKKEAGSVTMPTLPASCNFTESMEVTITGPAGAEIRYTTDGNAPTASTGTVFNAPFTINATTTVKTIAVLGGVSSSVAEATYTRVYTITLNQTTGGTISASSSQAAEGANVTLTATPNVGYTFGSWSVTPSVTLNGDSFTMPANNVTVSATFTASTTSCTVSFSVNNKVEMTATTFGGSIDLTKFVAEAQGYQFNGWSETETGNVITNPDSYTPQADITLYPQFGEIVSSGYTLVTNVNQLVAGNQVVIAANGDKNVAMSTTQKDNNRGVAIITKNDDNTISFDEEGDITGAIVCQFTLETSNNHWAFYDPVNHGYIYAASSSSNLLKTQEENNANGEWTIAINDNAATITAQGDNTRNLLRYNSSNDIFSCYASGQQTVWLYTKPAAKRTRENVEATSKVTGIAANVLVTVKNGGIVYLTGNNNGNEANLIVEDGGQLVASTNVKGTMLKSITGYGTATSGNYYFISTPLTQNTNPQNVENMINANGYDLYYFKQNPYVDPETGIGLEWQNYKVNEFSLYVGGGYLYANSESVDLKFAGNLRKSTETYEKGIAYEGTQNFAGWNLVGNPFPTNAKVNKPYYKMNGSGSGINLTPVDANEVIAAMEGVFVMATEGESNEKVTFTSTTDAVTTQESKGIVLEVNRNNEMLDRAIVDVNQGDMLRKLRLSEGVTELYIPQGNKDYAIVRSAAEAEMPVSFRASENGTYTLAVEAENVEMNYLHLIDNLTGMDVDLLQTPSYTFEAKTSDYASRFRLVFKANGTNENNAETFAYFNGTNWTVSNVGDATLQVVDVTGRTVANQMINGNAELNLNQPAGVYVIRLVNGDNVKTQKVVVR
jgi:uncharacterized repeat protein (TIGR02543 family)